MLANQSSNLAEDCSRFSQQQDSNAHCGRDENHCTSSVSLHITHLFCGGIPEVDRLRDRARQIRCKPQKEKDFDRPPLHQHQSNTRSRPDANSFSPDLWSLDDIENDAIDALAGSCEVAEVWGCGVAVDCRRVSPVCGI